MRTRPRPCRVRITATAAAVTVMLAALAAACGAGAPQPPCTVIRFADGVEEQWARARAAVDFEPVRPCARDRRLTVSGVFADTVPGDGGGFAPRFNQAVTRDGEGLFVFSQGRASVAFLAIPNGTRPLVVPLEGEGEPARGFIGTSASGAAIAYVRWRTDAGTFEVTATLRSAFTEADLVALVRGTAGTR